MTTVTFYHSAICPRCRLASLTLKSVMKDYPHIELKRVEYLANLRTARDMGVRSIPALSSGDRMLNGFLLSRSSIRRFLDSLEAGHPPVGPSSPQTVDDDVLRNAPV